jgi:ribonuclease HII
MTVSQIAQLLEEKSVEKEILEQLQLDSRISVTRLVHKWIRQQAVEMLEKQRVHNLYHKERILTRQGYPLITGVDEAGRGPLAGPVVIAAVMLPLNHYLPFLNDSKKLSPKQRENLYIAIKQAAVAVNHIVVDVDKIDSLNIYQATIRGMYQAIAGLKPFPQAALIDAVPLPKLAILSTSLIGGDAISASIAAASIIAKVERDHLMEKMDQKYPQYGFAKHKGYGTADHIRAIRKYGPCPIHRRSFEPIKSWEGTHCESR